MISVLVLCKILDGSLEHSSKLFILIVDSHQRYCVFCLDYKLFRSRIALALFASGINGYRGLLLKTAIFTESHLSLALVFS